jgi:hypothetical protein
LLGLWSRNIGEKRNANLDSYCKAIMIVIQSPFSPILTLSFLHDILITVVPLKKGESEGLCFLALGAIVFF